MTKVRNSTIDIFRYLAALMVVAIHVHPFSDVHSTLGYLFTEVLTRIGVPFFFATAGYFYMQKLERGEKVFWSYIKRLLVPYTLWTCIYYVVDFFSWGYGDLPRFLKNSVIQYLITGSAYHFWFFPALIFSVCAVTVLYKWKMKKLLIPVSIGLYLLGCLGTSYYQLGVKIPLLGKLFDFSQFELIRRWTMMAFPFFISGYLVRLLQEKAEACSGKRLWLLFAGAVVLWGGEICLVELLNWRQSVTVTVGLYLLLVVTLLLLIRYPMPKWQKSSGVCRVLANFTYYSHVFWIMMFRLLELSLASTPKFLVVVALTGISGYVVYKINHKWLNKLAY